MAFPEEPLRKLGNAVLVLVEDEECVLVFVKTPGDKISESASGRYGLVTPGFAAGGGDVEESRVPVSGRALALAPAVCTLYRG